MMRPSEPKVAMHFRQTQHAVLHMLWEKSTMLVNFLIGFPLVEGAVSFPTKPLNLTKCFNYDETHFRVVTPDRGIWPFHDPHPGGHPYKRLPTYFRVGVRTYLRYFGAVSS